MKLLVVWSKHSMVFLLNPIWLVLPARVPSISEIVLPENHFIILKYLKPFINPLVTVPNAPITIGVIVTCMFHSFFNSLARSRYLSFFSHSFSFILWSAGTAKSTILQVFFFLLIIIIIIIIIIIMLVLTWF